MAKAPALRTLLILLLVSVKLCGSTLRPSLQSKVCFGTSNGLAGTDDKKKSYDILKSRYENCTFVDGNLEISWLDGNDNYDMSFLKDIQEVTGYVLLVGIYADYIPLTNLRIIRGNHLYEHQGRKYSLYIALNTKPGSRTVGLKELQFISLSEIMSGDVLLYNNNLLCYENTIYWDDILTGEGARHHIQIDNTHPHRPCSPCHESCAYKGTRHCWGAGPDMCQILRRVKCSPQCEGTCFGTMPNECCHPQCAGGCTGPTKSECWACRKFYDNDTCVDNCPPEQIYDRKEFKMVPNPDVKYAFGNLCMKDCPYNYPKKGGACVRSCSDGWMEVDGYCKRCEGACPKACEGIPSNSNCNHYLNANNSQQYRGCTKIEGNLKIIDSSFKGDPHCNIAPMHPSQLEVLSSVKEITGHIMIQMGHPEMKTLSFFRNLEIIRGRTLDTYRASLQIFSTELEWLGLVSLKKIYRGHIIIMKNRRLCYTDKMDWSNLITDRNSQNINLKRNRPADTCRAKGKVCDPQCSDAGCWGPGNARCLRCRNAHLDNTCIERCDLLKDYFDAGNQTCAKCHSECKSSCIGPDPDQCVECLNVKDGPFCLNQCPLSKYPDTNSICQNCHENCKEGCTGPKNTVGPDACNTCDMALLDEQENIVQCLPSDYRCSNGYFLGIFHTREVNHSMAGKTVCKVCHPQCKTCNGPGLGFCVECRYYRNEGKCVQNCPDDTYTDKERAECSKCHKWCRGCEGPTNTDCKACLTYKVYLDGYSEDSGFNCTDECPPHLNNPIKEDGGNYICAGTDHPVIAKLIAAENDDKRKTKIIVGVTVSAVCIITLGLILSGYFWRQRARSREQALKLTARMTGVEETEPLTPTDALPDLSKLRLIKESDLRRGGIIGSGAFGTVYKGVWIPEGENVKIPVAIKVLQEGTSANLNKELLEEARIMASVEHQCCVRILAVCMTAQMMLVTQLMPLGCLLDYVRKNSENIGSKVLLNWCTQIARGMCYLEERGIVHRDLAARNVLVQNPMQVKITDFGLAKLLDYDEEEFKSAGGKMPIKWLALECIQHKIFTHKSDIWSFGVTVWELFTYGQRPYENVRARDVADLLEKGERLPQPSICTIDVYMIMIKCWMLDAESRPSFKELRDEFAKMARDPGRYLVIQGDMYMRPLPEENSASCSVHAPTGKAVFSKKGDKLMRLPSHTYDTRDLLRTMSIGADGPEEVLEADDYLQPQASSTPPPDQIHMPENMLFHKPLLPEDSSYDNDRRTPETDVIIDHILPLAKKVAAIKHLNGSPAVRNRGDSINSRYSSDPCKILLQGRDPVDEIPVGTGMNKNNMNEQQQKGVTLLVDEDDYLQPKSTNPAAYMDLIASDGQDYLEPKPTSGRGENGYPSTSSDYLSPVSPSGIENPEYFDGNVSTDSVFQPDNEKDALWTRPVSVNPASLQSRQPKHDYYNEYDKLDFKGPLRVLNSKNHAESVV